MKQVLTFTLDGAEATTVVSGTELLLDVLRDSLGHLGTKEGCGRGGAAPARCWSMGAP